MAADCGFSRRAFDRSPFARERAKHKCTRLQCSRPVHRNTRHPLPMSPKASQRPCSYRKYDDDPLCRLAGFYLLELVSRQGPRTQVIVCKEHVHKAWEFGQRMLIKRFPNRNLRLAAIRLMPILEATRCRAMAAGAE